MKKMFLFFALIISFKVVDAMKFVPTAQTALLRKYQTVCNQFKRGVNITEIGGASNFYEKTITMLKNLQHDKDWRPNDNHDLNDASTKQSVANAINQKVLYLISQKKLEDASTWLEVQRAFTKDIESVSRNEFLLKNLGSNAKGSEPVSNLPFLLFTTHQHQ